MPFPESAATTIKSAVKRVVVGDRHHGGVIFSDISNRGYDLLPDLEDGTNGDQYSIPKLQLVRNTFIIDPNSCAFRVFWYMTIAAASWTGVIKAYLVAFHPEPSMHPYIDSPAIHEYVLTAIFLVDMVVKFHLAFVEHEQLVKDPRRIRARYLRKLFWVDLVALLPVDLAMLLAAGHMRHSGPISFSRHALACFQMARCLRLLRMYRVPQLFMHLEYNLNLSLLVVTLVRNFVFTYFSVHWSACVFYYIARIHGLGKDTWIGHDMKLLHNSTPFERYIYAVYWSITTLATVGFGDFSARNIPETVWSTVYMFYNLGLSAYILGSFTLIVIRGDEQVGEYRAKCSNLKDYAKLNGLPKDLRKSMESHLRLYYENEETSDEAVLATVPGTIRRRILRHLYAEQLHKTYLFQGCRQKFLDAVLAVSRVEVYRPLEDVLIEGDGVNELYLVVSGACDTIDHHDGSEDPSMRGGDQSSRRTNQGTLKHQSQTLGPGQLFGEIAFFTEVPQLVGVRASEVTRVLTITRTAYNGAASAFPLGARSVLENLREKAEDMVKEHFPREQQRHLSQELKRVGSEHLSMCSRNRSSGCHKRLPSSASSKGRRSDGGDCHNEATSGERRKSKGGASSTANDDSEVNGSDNGGGGIGQSGRGNSGDICKVGSSGISLKDSSFSTARGNMSGGGNGDNDNVSGKDTRKDDSGSGSNRKGADNACSTVSRDAERNGGGGSSGNRNSSRGSGDLATSESSGLRSICTGRGNGNANGVRVSGSNGGGNGGNIGNGRGNSSSGGNRRGNSSGGSGGSGNRTGNGSSGSGGSGDGGQSGSDSWGESDAEPENLAFLSFACGSPELMPEASSADGDQRDPSVRSGVSFSGTSFTAGDSARSQAIRRVVGTDQGLSIRQQQVLSGAMRIRTLIASAVAKSNEQRNSMFLTACSAADTDTVLQMLQQGHSAQACDYDGRTGVMLAAAGGHHGVIRILLAARADVNAVDNTGRTALDEACSNAHDNVAQQLKHRGARLGAHGVRLASQLCEAVFEGDMPMLRRLVAAGAAVDAYDYDKRTALHIAASEGNLCAVKLLVEEGGAKASVRDRWGAIPLAEAFRVRAQPVVDYLLPRSPAQVQEGPGREASIEAVTKYFGGHI